MLCVWIYQSPWCTFSTHQKNTGFTHFWRCKYKFVSSLQTKCQNEFVWHPHLSMTTTAVLISAQILFRRDKWGLFSFSLAVWNNSFGQSIMLLSKMPAKHSQRQEKRPPAQTKTLDSSLLFTSGTRSNSNWAPCSGLRVAAGLVTCQGGRVVPADPAPSEPRMSLSWGTLPAPEHGNQPLTLSISSAPFQVTLQITQFYQAETNCPSHTINGRGATPTPSL